MRKKLYRVIAFQFLIAMFYLFFSEIVLAAQIRLAWNQNTELDLGGYKVYYGKASRVYGNSVDAGNVMNFILDGLTSNQTYYIVITAYDNAGNESVFSTEVSGIAIDVVTPGPTVTPTITPSPTPPPTTTPTTTPTTQTGGYWANYWANYWTNFWARYKELLSRYRLPGWFGRIYLAASQVDTDGSFIGNLKSYALSIKGDPKTGAKVGILLDAYATPAYDSNGQISSDSTSFWSSEIDGNKVNKGGLGELLVSRSSPRTSLPISGSRILQIHRTLSHLRTER